MAREARLIILDVVLAEDPDVVDEAENGALRRAMKPSATSGPRPPVLFAGAYEAALPSDDRLQPAVKLALPLLLPEDAPRIRVAAALPAPEQPVRRYPKCLVQQGVTDVRIPTLPFLAAQLLLSPGRSPLPCQPSAGTEGGHNAPRIVYTLPAMSGHQDDVATGSRLQWAHYRSIYDRCLAASFWEPGASHCGRAEAYRNRVVVVGASNPLRRDRHYTPLGDMAGPEVVINAVRSFVSYPAHRDKTLSELLAKKALIVAWCSLVWLAYFLVRCRLLPPLPHGTSLERRRVARSAIVGAAFLVALAGVVLAAVFGSFHMDGPIPSMDVLVPVLAIAVDEYVEQASRIVHGVETAVGRALGLAAGHGEPAAHQERGQE
jgi:hypothetical protein